MLPFSTHIITKTITKTNQTSKRQTRDIMLMEQEFVSIVCSCLFYPYGSTYILRR